jgi:ribose 1,5-bisphosphokinase
VALHFLFRDVESTPVTMSLISELYRLLTGRSPLIGPGRLVLVVGPSGAGKDTLIARARAACREDRAVVFPRRIVTRPPSAFEDNELMPQQAFEQAVARGAFAFCWSAHGHSYGIPVAIDAEIEAGRTVVCNVSRMVVEEVRARYANVMVVLITAPREVLAARLAARGRPSDVSIAERVDRSELAGAGLRPDVIINNVGEPDVGARKLVDTIYASGVLVA